MVQRALAARVALRTCASLLALAAIASNALAQVEPAEPAAVTLPEALARARSHHPSLLVWRQRVTAALYASEIPRARWFPSAALGIELLEGTSNNTTASYLALPGVGLPRIGATRATATGDFAPEPSTLAGLGVSQEVFDFGRTAALTALADTQVRAERLGAERERLLLTLAVAESYFAVGAAHEIVRASDQAYERASVHRDEARAKVGAGLRSPIDLTRAEADLAHYDVGRMRAAGGLGIAEVALAASVGDANGALDVRGDPPPLPALPSPKVVVDTAIQKHPELGLRLARVAAARAETELLAASARPEAKLNASISARAGGATPSSGAGARFGGYVPEVPNWDVALLLSWPFFDEAVRAKRRAAEGRERVAEAEMVVAREDLVVRARRAYETARLAEASMPTLLQARDAARANYAQAEARFGGGLATTVELADAEALRTQTEIDVAMGHFEVLRARAALSEITAEEP